MDALSTLPEYWWTFYDHVIIGYHSHRKTDPMKHANIHTVFISSKYNTGYSLQRKRSEGSITCSSPWHVTLETALGSCTWEATRETDQYKLAVIAKTRV